MIIFRFVVLGSNGQAKISIINELLSLSNSCRLFLDYDNALYEGLIDWMIGCINYDKGEKSKMFDVESLPPMWLCNNVCVTFRRLE